MGPVTSPILRLTLRRGTVYKMPSPDVPTPHYSIVLNYNPRDDELIVLSLVTSSIEKRRAHARDVGLPPDTIVEIGPSDYVELDHDSCVDCNSLKILPAQEYQWRVHHYTATLCRDIPQPMLEQIVNGVLASPEVSDDIKKLIRAP